ncbi:MAG: substrate-binding domain-containing protein, partial [Candidatus Binatia bacterium]
MCAPRAPSMMQSEPEDPAMPFILTLILLLTATATAAPPLRVATTTSTQDSGLLDVLNPAFTAATSIPVDIIAVGSGKALALGRNGDVDVVLAHDPDAEARFIADGAGIDRREVMVNEFLVVGPADDPAAVRGADSAAAALARIARHGAPFVSRGDQSGTHVRELALFRAAGIDPAGPWYFAAGQGMNPVLQIADEKLAYTLVDRGTWLARRARL